MKQQGSILTISMHQVLMLNSKLTQSMTKSKPSIIISHHATLNIQEVHAVQPTSKPITNCKYCAGTHQPRKCPAYDKQCNNCGRKEHYAKVCLSKKESTATNKPKVHEVTAEDPDVVYTLHNAATNQKEWYVDVKCDSNSLQLKVDTGASCNVMPNSVFKHLKLKKLEIKSCNQKLSFFGGHQLKVLGRISLLLECKKNFSVHDFVLVEQGETTLLGLPSSIAMRLVETACTILNNAVVSEFSDVFQGLGKLPCNHALRLKEGIKPVVQSARRVPFRLRDKLKCTLDNMESSGTITKVKQPTDWVHPIVNVLKPDGSLRVCLDPTELNTCIMRKHFSLSTATEIFSRLSNSRVFTTLAATSVFLQLELDHDSSYLTTFATPFGRYRFLRLPFGIRSAPEVLHIGQ